MLDEAENFILGLEKQEAILWQTLLSACHNHRDVERAQRGIVYIDEVDKITRKVL